MVCVCALQWCNHISYMYVYFKPAPYMRSSRPLPHHLSTVAKIMGGWSTSGSALMDICHYTGYYSHMVYVAKETAVYCQLSALYCILVVSIISYLFI